MNLSRYLPALALAGIMAAVSGAAAAAETARPYITVASTTSTDNTGLFRDILPLFRAKTGIDVRVLAVGTGQALDIGRRGDCDVVLVHDREAEERYLTEGFGTDRRDVMYNDFVLIGPQADPAGIAGSRDVTAALLAIRAAQAPFLSRGDRSGTHTAELRLWRAAGVDLEAGNGSWYRETGAGMGATLNTASAMDAYVLSDRGTWIAFRNRGRLEILVDGDERLFNQYGVMMVNPERHPQVKRAEAQAFIDWLVSPEGQAAIGGFTVNGEQLFFPNAGVEPGPTGRRWRAGAHRARRVLAR